MLRLFQYILACAFLFAILDWKVVHLTRLTHPEWKEWIHQHEREYAAATRLTELVLCAPAVALKPVFYQAAMSAEASQEEQDEVGHAPKPTFAGFWHLPVRGESWTFVSWFWWFAYWLPISLIWYGFARRFV